MLLKDSCGKAQYGADSCPSGQAALSGTCTVTAPNTQCSSRCFHIMKPKKQSNYVVIILEITGKNNNNNGNKPGPKAETRAVRLRSSVGQRTAMPIGRSPHIRSAETRTQSWRPALRTVPLTTRSASRLPERPRRSYLSACCSIRTRV